MKSGTGKDAPRQDADSRGNERNGAWPAARAYAITPPALIPFGGFMPPRSDRRKGRESARR